MLRPRVIPCLLLQNGGLVKTVRFASPKYVGDPLNAVKIFNEKEVDELLLLDIAATAERREPDYSLIRNVAAECRMPLCYGGGVRNAQQAARIIELGVEKVALSSAFIERADLATEVAARVGSQSVVAVLDVARNGRDYEIRTENGKRVVPGSVVERARDLERSGAGEIVLNSVDRDGTLEGYDLDLVRMVRSATSVPLSVLGGAGTLSHIKTLIDEFGPIGAAAGSMFVFKGPYRAVLINYPDRARRETLWASSPVPSQSPAATAPQA